MNRLVIGVGNVMRRDDGAGIAVARLLKKYVTDGVKVREETGEGASLMAAWQDSDSVIIVDAMSSGDLPGTIRRFDAAEDRLPAGLFHYSTHAFSVAEAVELARELGELPDRVILYGIEGEDFSFGDGCTAAVDSSIDEVVRLILADLQSGMKAGPGNGSTPSGQA
jgi:hydrogenase maturation protease